MLGRKTGQTFIAYLALDLVTWFALQSLETCGWTWFELLKFSFTLITEGLSLNFNLLKESLFNLQNELTWDARFTNSTFQAFCARNSRWTWRSAGGWWKAIIKLWLTCLILSVSQISKFEVLMLSKHCLPFLSQIANISHQTRIALWRGCILVLTCFSFLNSNSNH